MRLAMLALCALSACSFDASGVNPATDGAVPVADAAPDAAPPVSCNGRPEGSRLCDGNFVSQCSAGGAIVHERPCATGSACLGGECAVSPLQRACSSDALCLAPEICTPFVTHPMFTTMVELRCAAPDAAAGPGPTLMQCTQGTDCRSGICADGGFCFGACLDENECGAELNNAECRSIPLHVDGVVTVLRGCGPSL